MEVPTDVVVLSDVEEVLELVLVTVICTISFEGFESEM